MLTVIPKRRLSSTFVVARNGEPVGQLRQRALREKATALLDGTRYTMANALVGRDFWLEAGGRPLARADKRALRYAFDVSLGPGVASPRSLVFESAGLLVTGQFVLFEEGRVVGEVSKGPILRGARAAFDIDLALPVQLFLLWVALAMWRRDRRRQAR